MKCAWNELLKLVPLWMREDVDKYGSCSLQELRLRVGQPPKLQTKSCTTTITGMVKKEDLNYVLNAATKYSPWAAGSIAHGYITAVGGHRIGVCGDVVINKGMITSIQNVTSINIRVARDFMGIGAKIPRSKGSILMIGAPGSGKTTLMRDLIRQISENECINVGVVDERGELCPSVNGEPCFYLGPNTDVLNGCSKDQGIDMLLRTMNPGCIAVDEITAEADCCALVRAGWCGVRLLATAHAASLNDLLSRPVYRTIMDKNLFETLIIMEQDKSWSITRLPI